MSLRNAATFFPVQTAKIQDNTSIVTKSRADKPVEKAHWFVPNAYFSPLLQPIRDVACVGIHLRRRDKVHAMGASEAVPSWETTVEGVWETNNRTLTLVKAISHR